MNDNKDGFSLMNLVSGNAVLVSYLLLPFYIYEVNKSSRTGFQTAKYMSIRNYMVGYSCADIESILWDYGIPTHCADLDERETEGHRYLEFGFYVPSSQHFMSDCLLRQNADRFGFTVMTPVVYQGEIPSTRYKGKQWKRLGIPAKPKSWTVRIGQFLFGHMLSKKKLPTKDRRQSAKNRQKKNITS